ncbi:MAG: GTP-binding protein [Planctomycetia bacterium]
MVQINFAQKEVQCKIVYYGPGMSGKTTNLELVHGKVPESARGELTSIATTGERTLYFDYMPLDLGQIAGIRTKFQLYTVPGQVYYKSTRRLVLQGVDGVVFVADSNPAKMAENKESLADLEENLRDMGRSLKDVPIILQWNKRDMPDALPVAELERELNPHGFPTCEAIARTGEGVFATLKELSARVLEAVNKGGLAGAKARPAAAPAAATTVKAPAPVAAPRPTLVAAPAAPAVAASVPASAPAPVAPPARVPMSTAAAASARPVPFFQEESQVGTAVAEPAPAHVGHGGHGGHGEAAPLTAAPAYSAPAYAPPYYPAATSPAADAGYLPPAAPLPPAPEGTYTATPLHTRVVEVSGMGGPRLTGRVLLLIVLLGAAAAAAALLL